MATYLYQTEHEDETQYEYQCGPLAIYNFLQTNANLTQLIHACHAIPEIGTLAHTMTQVLTQFSKNKPIQHLVSLQITYSALEAIAKTRPVILLYHWTNGDYYGNHYVLVSKQTDSWLLQNYSPTCPVKTCTARKIKTLLLPHTDANFITPQIWYNK
jgi:hypothetical protein